MLIQQKHLFETMGSERWGYQPYYNYYDYYTPPVVSPLKQGYEVKDWGSSTSLLPFPPPLMQNPTALSTADYTTTGSPTNQVQQPSVTWFGGNRNGDVTNYEMAGSSLVNTTP